jgi:glycerate-2-kinase
VLEKYELWEGMPPGVQNIIKEGLAGKTPETAKEETWDWNRVRNYIIANNQSACLAACRRASVLGYGAVLPPSKISGEAREAGKEIVRKMKSYKKGRIALVGGGETTVRVRGNGKGGRNQESVLGTVEAMRDKPLVFASFGTDGIDGNTDAAGAIADGQTFERALDSHLNPEDYLKRNDSYNFFRKLEDLLITGPTNTNVMDLQILLKYK